MSKKSTLIMQETCDKCGVTRKGEKVFSPCKCVTRKLYSEVEEATIRREFNNARELIEKFEMTPVFTDIGHLLNMFARMNLNAMRMINACTMPTFYSKLRELIDEVRRMTTRDFINKGGKDINLFKRISNISPKDSVIIGYKKCVYVEHHSSFCHISPTEHGLCYKHIMMFYIAHDELCGRMPPSLVTLSLHYLLAGYEEVRGCVPILTKNQPVAKRARVAIDIE